MNGLLRIPGRPMPHFQLLSKNSCITNIPVTEINIFKFHGNIVHPFIAKPSYRSNSGRFTCRSYESIPMFSYLTLCITRSFYSTHSNIFSNLVPKIYLQYFTTYQITFKDLLCVVIFNVFCKNYLLIPRNYSHRKYDHYQLLHPTISRNIITI